ncbi:MULTISPECIES: hypothetical protein [Xanthobacter]|uniref:hypothetical protein n=1 Tax=Xanthobacter TaxID=279 RepID=UPI001F30C25E|nr:MULTISPECIES: hypothetical protein [unclassified Xanthobacter]
MTQPAVPGSVNWTNVLTVGSAAILIATQAIATAIAAGWAVAGLFSLGDVGEYALMGLFALLGIYVSVLYFRRAAKAEPLRH